MFEYFAKRKEEKEKQKAAELRENQINEVRNWYSNSKTATRKDFLDKLYTIDETVWYNELNEDEKRIIDLTREFNRGTLNRDKYKEFLKELDPETWKTLATKDELDEFEIMESYKVGNLSDKEYDRKMCDLKKIPYVDFGNISFNEDGKHAVELEYNEYFVEKLRSVGHVGDTDDDVVNSWFVAFCTSIAAESESVIIANPDDIQKVNYEKNGTKSEYR